MSDDLRNRVARAIYDHSWMYDRTKPWTLAPENEKRLTYAMADAALAEIGGLKVRKLDWAKELSSANPSYSPNRASTPFGSYYANEHAFWLEGGEAQKCQGREAAKAAAQADYEARILAAIEPAPVSVREAARVLLDEWRHGEGPLGELCCYSLGEDGTMQPDIDGRWVEFTKIEAALFRDIAEGKDDE